jgi:aldehyde:ferredoxin oxidoreductase
MFGYMGTILHVNLSSGEVRRDAFDEVFARRFLGGNGFAARLIYEKVPAQVEPLSEDNAVVFALGPLNGTTVWGSGRGHVAAISPLTGYFADSNFGGNFAAMLKKTGMDALIISGKASEPVYLLLEDDARLTIKPAGELWGKTTSAAQALLVEREGKGVESASIGPAGEQQVLFANIMCSGQRVSTAGRGGIGAVLGAKLCKAIAVKGNQRVTVADQAQLSARLKARLPIMKDNTNALTNLGTPVLVNLINSMGKLATRNNTRETFERAETLSGEYIAEHHTERNVACYRCPVACGKLVRIPHGAFADHAEKMPEYETIYALGSMLENADIVSVYNANTMCDQMGLDTISMGVTLAFVAECLETGLVSADDLGGRVGFGDSEPLAELVRLTALQEGVGVHLARGSERLAAEWGRGAEKLLYSVQGMEIAGHSARGIRPMGLAYATSTRGGSHHDARPNYNEPDGDPGFTDAAAYCVHSQHYTALGDSLVLCRFVMERGFGTPLAKLDAALPEVLRAVTGWDLTLSEIATIGERVYNLERLINTRRGLTRAQDTLPYRVTHKPIPDGPAQGRYCPEDQFQSLLDEYYDLRGWNADGIPTDAKLAELELL